ncbi:MAG: hypothetical protein CL917_02515 [Deltaproteobacteria bacterium]|nr:hypothetical protein [Deltaproteobacteria bacterium]
MRDRDPGGFDVGSLKGSDSVLVQHNQGIFKVTFDGTGKIVRSTSDEKSPLQGANRSARFLIR